MKMELRPQQDYTGNQALFEVLLDRDALLLEYDQAPDGCWEEFKRLVKGFEEAGCRSEEPWTAKELADMVKALRARPQCPGIVLSALGDASQLLTYDFA